MDFYYQTLVIYLLFFIVYAIIKGSLYNQDDTGRIVLNDPIIYILILFISTFLIIVVMNIIRSRQIVMKSDRIVLRNRFGSREILFSDILNIRIIKKRIPKEHTPYRIIKLKLRNRKRKLRIRANEYEHGNELIKEFLNIKNLNLT